MSQNVMDEEFDAFGGEAGPPVPSWETLGVGGKTRGVILPQVHPKSGAILSYLTTQQTSMAEPDKPSVPLWYDNDEDGATFHTRPRLQAEFYVQTEIRDFSDCSDQRREYAEKNDQTDDGIRRVIVKGKTGSDSMKRNGRRTFSGQGRPVIGAYIDYSLTRKNRLPSGFKENVTECAFALPDSASLAIVQNYMAENMPDQSFGAAGPQDAFSGPTEAKVPAAASWDDPWTNTTGDEPPF
jgi:hypothetical protein